MRDSKLEGQRGGAKAARGGLRQMARLRLLGFGRLHDLGFVESDANAQLACA
jgi:hypothetical protein